MYNIKSIFGLLFFFLGTQLFSQKTEILDDFSIYALNKTVYISCTITQGQTCNGINVWRSTDTINFNLVGHVDGICGSSATPVPYNFTDESPVFNQVSYYRVELGGSGFSEILSIELVDTRLFRYQVRPNPANERAVVYFDNDSFDTFQFSLYNIHGKLQQRLLTSTNEFEVSTIDLSEGLYLFVIESVDGTVNPVKGKLVVHH